MDANEVRRKHKEYLFPCVNTLYEEPLVPLRAQGTVVVGADGREYRDFFGGILTVPLGHCHPKVTDAVVEQQRSMVHISTLYPTEQQVQVAEKVAQIVLFSPAKSFFTNSGTEADETAVALAKHYTGRRDLVVLRHAYAGRTSTSQAMMGQAPWRLLDTEVPGIKHAHAPYCYRCDFRLKYPDCGMACAEDVKTLIQTTTRGEIAGMLAEPILGVGGFVVPPPEYFEIVSKIVRDHGGVFIADEVQTGIGRTGRWFAAEHFPNFVPDIITAAKGMGNGQPIGLTVARGEIADSMRGKLSLSTFGGNPVSMVAARTTMQVIEEENLLFNAQMMGQRLRDGLEQIQRDFPARIGDVRGVGLMQGVEFVTDPQSKTPDAKVVARVLEETKKRGLLIGKGGMYGNMLRIAPALIVTPSEVDEALKVLAESFKGALA